MSQVPDELPFAWLRDLRLDHLPLLPLVELLDDPWLRGYVHVKLYGQALLVQRPKNLTTPDPTHLVFRKIPRP